MVDAGIPNRHEDLGLSSSRARIIAAILETLWYILFGPKGTPIGQSTEIPNPFIHPPTIKMADFDEMIEKAVEEGVAPGLVLIAGDKTGKQHNFS